MMTEPIVVPSKTQLDIQPWEKRGVGNGFIYMFEARSKTHGQWFWRKYWELDVTQGHPGFRPRKYAFTFSGNRGLSFRAQPKPFRVQFDVWDRPFLTHGDGPAVRNPIANNELKDSAMTFYDAQDRDVCCFDFGLSVM